MTFGHAIANRYTKMGGNQSHVHLRLLSAKAALIKSAIPHPLKAKMLSGYQSAEKQIFGHSTSLPGEGELGVGGMGTTFGMRRELRQAGSAEANPVESPGQSDFYQSVLSRLSGE